MKYNMHYIWIGPFKGDRFDVNGPSLMVMKGNDSYEVKFWCLSRHKAKYTSYFSRYGKGIEVISIEDYLANLMKSFWCYQRIHIWAVSTAKDFINKIAIREGMSSCYIRDIVNAKNLISLFLLYYEGGFIADTSIYPLLPKSKKYIKKLPNHPIFPASPETIAYPDVGSVFYVQKKSTDWGSAGDNNLLVHSSLVEGNADKKNINVKTKNFVNKMNSRAPDILISPVLECWFMYSPKHHKISWDALEYYLRYLPVLYETISNLDISSRETLLNIEKYEEMLCRFHSKSASAIISSLVHALYQNNIIVRRRGGRRNQFGINQNYLFKRQCNLGSSSFNERPTLLENQVYKSYGGSHKLRDNTRAYYADRLNKYYSNSGNVITPLSKEIGYSKKLYNRIGARF